MTWPSIDWFFGAGRKIVHRLGLGVALTDAANLQNILNSIDAQKGAFVRGFNPVDFDTTGGGSAVMVNFTSFGDTYQGLRFANAATRTARLNAGVFAADYDNSFNPQFVITFIAPGASLAAGNVRLQIDVGYTTPATAFSNALAYNETILLTQAVPATGVGQIALFSGIFTCNGALSTPLQRISMKVSRLGADAADTYTGDVIMIGSIHSYRRTTI